MHRFVGHFCCCLLLLQSSTAAGAASQQATNNGQQQTAALVSTPTTLEDGTPVKLRIAQTVSSADAHVNDSVEFEVLEDIRIADTLIVPKGGIAWGTVTEAQPKRRLGRGGKLEVVMDSVRLVDGEKAALRATKAAQGGGHVGGMTAGIVVTGLIFWPAAPFFLFMHGKDITIPKDTEVPTFINGNFSLELAKFHHSAPSTTPTTTLASAVAEVEIRSTPDGAEIQLDGTFVGSTPSTIGVSEGDHVILVKKNGYKPWDRNIKVTSGKIGITAELEATP